MAITHINVQRIERDMLARGWNQQALAKATHLAPTTIGRFLNGSYQTAKTLKRIAYALDKPVEAYLGKGAAA